ncbi:MAG: VIT domain-containing protein [Candidatus Latescibacterota bacterium]
MKRLLCTLVIGIAGSALPGPLVAQEVPPAADRTLAPFFFVKAQDPSVDQLPLKDVAVEAQVVGVIADVTVRQTYMNEGDETLEAIYIFPASTRAAVYGMEMAIGTRRIRAQIREREAARQEYEEAREEGRTASLLEEQRPNVFQMSVANILPGDTIHVELRYTELLVPTEGMYEFVCPTVVGPRYTTKTAETALPQDLYTQTPYQHEGEPPLYTYRIHVGLATGLPVAEVGSPSHQVHVEGTGQERLSVALDEGERYGGSRDFVLRYRLAGDRIQSGVLLFEGEDESFFLAMAQPPAQAAVQELLPRDYVFIMDVSGSMAGYPIEVSKTLLRDLVGSLKAGDTFNLLLFAGSSAVLSEEPLPATPQNLDRAMGWIGQQAGGGGTELLPALRRALDLPRPAQHLARTVVIATDGYVTVEPEAFDLIRTRLQDASVFAFGIGTSVNRFLIEGLARVGMGEPFVVLDAAAAPASAERFRRYVQTPVLTDVRFEAEGLGVYDIEPLSVPAVFAARPVIVFGKWRAPRAGTLRIRGQAAGGPYEAAFGVAQVQPDEGHRALRYLWARHRIAVLNDYNGLYDYNGRSQDPERVEEVTRLGLEYGLLTPYTSFVAVDERVRSDGTVETVTQPLPLPQGVTDNAVGGAGASAVEEDNALWESEALAGAASRPARPTLEQNAPNPFNASTQIGYVVPPGYRGEVRLVICDLAGQVVRVLTRRHEEAGRFTFTWDGTDDGGLPVASGLYLYRIDGGSPEAVRRMLLVR